MSILLPVSFFQYGVSRLGDLGTTLKEAREAKNITLEQIEADLKIKPRYIEAIEAENFDIFPAAPMVRGFIRNYATYLELDATELLSRYQANHKETGRKKGRRKANPLLIELAPARRRSFFNPDALITFLIITALLGSAAFFAYTQYLEPAQAQLFNLPAAGAPAATPRPVVSEPALLLPTPTLPPTDTPVPTPTPSPQYYTGVAVELVVHERSWVQILVDDVKTFEGFLEAGDRPNWVGEKRVAIRAGNGGGVEVFVNGQSMGFMGEPGQVIDQVWEKVDEIPGVESTPTSTVTPAATPAENG